VRATPQAAKKPASAGKQPSSAGRRPASAGKGTDGAGAGALRARAQVSGRVTGVGRACVADCHCSLQPDKLRMSASSGRECSCRWDRLPAAVRVVLATTPTCGQAVLVPPQARAEITRASLFLFLFLSWCDQGVSRRRLRRRTRAGWRCSTRGWRRPRRLLLAGNGSAATCRPKRYLNCKRPATLRLRQRWEQRWCVTTGGGSTQS